MKSMTGYGKGVVTEKGRTLTIELKAVNNRYLEINSRLPKVLSACDDIIRREIQAEIKRGSIDVFFNYENSPEDSRSVTIDFTLAGEYVRAAKHLRTEFCLENDFQTTALMRSPDVLKIDAVKDDPAVFERMARECVKAAIAELDRMRKTEGAAILKDLTVLTGNIASALKEAVKRAPKIVEEYRFKLESRIREALAAVQTDEARLINEVAFFADKSDINEEISRLASHLDQFTSALKETAPQGRKLEFISQEMNREINTIGSKSSDIALTGIVVYMKTELEKIKEQIRNVE